ncbi:Enduracididine beta-hydroxylase [compost metagenome]
MYRIMIEKDEMQVIVSQLDKLASIYSTVEDPEFLRNVTTYAQHLPIKLREALNVFRLYEPEGGVCVINGYQIDVNQLVQTPTHWANKPVPSPTIREDIFFSLCASLLGDYIGWATQQDGYLLHDIFPIEGHEQEQLGSGSECLLTWHTEDAFHPYRTDYLGLMCLKNPDDVETTFAKMNNIKLSSKYAAILFEKRFIIRPDESHLKKNRSSSERYLGASPDLLERSYERINQMNIQPEKVAVLFGDPDEPYLRIDPYFMDHIEDDEEAMEALSYLINEIDNQIESVALQSGDILFLDNYKVIHGRKPFKAKYDGNDRWLKRLNIVRDLRKSRDARVNPESRIIF